MTAAAETTKNSGKLDLNEVYKLMETHSAWALEGVTLVKRLSFENFLEALAYVNRLGALAEKEGHHPDIMFGWGYAEIRITTHDVGGLTAKDFALAEKIDTLK